MTWESKYTLIPFKDHGRTFSGVDCWGLVRLVYQTELGIVLPDHAEISPSDLRRIARMIDADKDAEIWQSVDAAEIQAFDVVVMSQYGGNRNAHVGLITTKKKLIHAEIGCGVVVVSLDHLTVKERIKCYRRHKRLP